MCLRMRTHALLPIKCRSRHASTQQWQQQRQCVHVPLPGGGRQREACDPLDCVPAYAKFILQAVGRQLRGHMHACMHQRHGLLYVLPAQSGPDAHWRHDAHGSGGLGTRDSAKVGVHGTGRMGTSPTRRNRMPLCMGFARPCTRAGGLLWLWWWWVPSSSHPLRGTAPQQRW